MTMFSGALEGQTILVTGASSIAESKADGGDIACGVNTEIDGC